VRARPFEHPKIALDGHGLWCNQVVFGWRAFRVRVFFTVLVRRRVSSGSEFFNRPTLDSEVTADTGSHWEIRSAPKSDLVRMSGSPHLPLTSVHPEQSSLRHKQTHCRRNTVRDAWTYTHRPDDEQRLFGT
jgi:hypothetical protein